MKRSMFLVVAGLVVVGVAANVWAQRPQPKDSPKKGPAKGIQPKVNPPKGIGPRTTPIPLNPTPVNTLPVNTNTPNFGVRPPMTTGPITGYLGGGFNPALISPLNPFSPVNNPWNYVAPNPWNVPLDPWSNPWTPWTTVNPWLNPYGPNVNPLVNPLNPWNNPWAQWNPINNVGPWNFNVAPQFQFPINGPFAPLGPNFAQPVFPR